MLMHYLREQRAISCFVGKKGGATHSTFRRSPRFLRGSADSYWGASATSV
ncbi:Uncharacterized protein APZ42_005507 [Daphnia magna]|uniref:Uncharacterized protein n=1 Tax=Daphnia magna TaxID=35525 RepID=A0A162D4Z5_9CRUS|nr:Uncharacterized protein APZ42_005507 [Daphnia magna]